MENRKDMREKDDLHGFLVAVDGPNGVGKSTLIGAVEIKMKLLGYRVYITKEPTNTELGKFVRKFSENHFGTSLACLVAADRYEHIVSELVPELQKGSLVITDRYILSSLILQQMDGVNSTFIFDISINTWLNGVILGYKGIIINWIFASIMYLILKDKINE